MNWFPLASFDVIADELADEKLVAWEHFLGGCNRPFGRQSFGLFVANDLIAVAVSASTVNATCGGWSRDTVVELARLCVAPAHRWSTRVALRFWRELAPRCWAERYWRCDAVVSYQNAARHTGNIYKFDGWTRVAEVKPSRGGGTWTRPRQDGERKAIWVYVLGSYSDDQRRSIALERAA